MKNLFLSLALLFIVSTVCGQESFRKRYHVRDSITYNDSVMLYLKKALPVKYADWSESEKKKIRSEFQEGKTITITGNVGILGQQVAVMKTTLIDDSFYETLTKDSTQNVVLKGKGIRGDVKFEDNKVFVNPYLLKDKNNNLERRDICYYQLQDRQSVSLSFREITVTAITIPVKYRFSNSDFPEDFSTGFNANIFAGVSFGRTSFWYRKKVDNKTNMYKITLGAFLGASSVELNSKNTSASIAPLTVDEKYTKGLASIGFGGTYSYNKINLGLFYGWDYAVGADSQKWNYNHKPWLGLAIGYSLFNF